MLLGKLQKNILGEHKLNRTERNKEIRNLFTEDIIDSLNIFAQKIENENADIIILLARKAICLFELFNYLGIQKPTGEVVSDRVLDLDIQYFKEKKVLVVDDTFIVGTTLKNIKDKLLRNNIEHKIFVFCADKDNWKKNLIVPDYIQNYFSEQQVLNFCITEVEAFASVPIPYIIDFPQTAYIEVSNTDFNLLLNDGQITAICLKKDKMYEIEQYSIAADESLAQDFLSIVGRGFLDVLDVVKARLYVTESTELHKKIKILPLVLLKALHKKDINDLFMYLISFIQHKDNYEICMKFMESPLIQLRFIQYYLSLSFGRLLIDKTLSRYKEKYAFNDAVLINLFGKKIAKPLTALLRDMVIKPYEKRIKMEYINQNSEFADILSGIDVSGYNVLSAFRQVFINMFEKRELPARRNSTREGHEALLNNRLLTGISFESIAEFLCHKLNIELNNKTKAVLGICLDICNDLGISVPIISSSSGYYFRSYRHGELGKRTEGNNYLFYVFLNAFCRSNHYDYSKGFDRLLVEKLAVIFYRIGAKAKFIDFTTKYNDPNAVNIGFYLLGAILIENNGTEFFPNDQRDWFLSHNCTKLLKKSNSSNKYVINTIPEKKGLSLKDNAEYLAKQLGKTFGNLVKHSSEMPEDMKGHPLNLDRLMMLASCYSSGDICMALCAELNIIHEWVLLVKCSKNCRLGMGSFRDSFKLSTVYASFNSAYLKFLLSFSKDTNVKKIIEDAKLFLKHHSVGTDSLETWDDYVTKLGVGQLGMFDRDNFGDNDENTKLIKLSVEIANYVFNMGILLIYIRFLIEVFKNLQEPLIEINSQFRFLNLETNKEYTRTFVKKLKYDVEKGEIGYLTKAGKELRKKRINSKVEIEIQKKIYYVRIIDINNDNVILISPIELEKYAKNLGKLDDVVKMINVKLGIQSSIVIEEYMRVKNKMSFYRTCKDKEKLNRELIRIIEIMDNRTFDMELLIDKAKQLYTSSRRNLVDLL